MIEEDDIFDDRDQSEVVETSKDLLNEIKINEPFLDFSIPNSQIISELFDVSEDEFEMSK